MTTIADQIRAVIRERGHATTDEIVAALPDIPRRKIVDALRHMRDTRYSGKNPRGIVGTASGWMLKT